MNFLLLLPKIRHFYQINFIIIIIIIIIVVIINLNYINYYYFYFHYHLNLKLLIYYLINLFHLLFFMLKFILRHY